MQGIDLAHAFSTYITVICQYVKKEPLEQKEN